MRRRLGIWGWRKVIVRLWLRDRLRRTTGEPIELVVSDLTGSRMEIDVRPPETAQAPDDVR